MSPRSTFQSCGSSSSCVAFSARPDARVFELGAADELLAEVGAEPRLGVALERAELDDREDPPATADALAAVEDRQAARDGDGDGADDEPERKRQQPEDEREEDVEDAQLEVHAPLRRRARQRLEARDE